MANIWTTRQQSIEWLNSDLSDLSSIIDSWFSIIDRSMTILDDIAEETDPDLIGQFSRVSAGILSKSKMLSISCYSLTMDGLSQEAGAILRPLIEAYELLKYLRINPERTSKVLDGSLPQAGKIAKEIQGFNKEVREFLNDNSSHYSFSIESMRHLLDSDFKHKRFPTHSKLVFINNLQTLNSYLGFIAMESISCIYATGCEVDSLADESEELKSKSVKIFNDKLESIAL